MDFLVQHLLQASAKRFPDKEALVHRDKRLTYAAVGEKVTGLANGLQSIGLERGDRIGIYVEASIPQVLSIFGVSQAGGVFVPISGVLFPDQARHIVRDCRIKGLIITAEKLVALRPLLADMPSLEFVVVVRGNAPSPKNGDTGELGVAQHDFDEMCRTAEQSQPRDCRTEKDLAALLYTSGSTGMPKGVMLSHANVVAGATIVSTYLEITDRDRILAVLPFSFDAGLNQLTTAFQHGATLILTNFVLGRQLVGLIADENVSGLAGVPTFWSLLAQSSSGLAQRSLPLLRYITNTGGVMPQNVLKTLRSALTSTKVFLMYGLTEAFRSTYLPPEELDRRPTSMGRAIPDTEILVIDDAGKPCAPDVVGELVHRGPTVSMGYWGNPEATNRVLRPHPFALAELGDCERVCYSGDLVRMDEDGFLYFVGRRDTMIKSSGYRISPAEVEEVLFQSGQVRQVAVIGIPDELLGQTIKAFVVAKESTALDTDALLEHIASQRPRYMVPKAIEVLPELPKTSSGKVDYPALRKREGL